MNQGIFITFEGLDGSGKTTQVQLLADFLREQGYEVVLTREPGGTPLAEAIRQVILTPTDEALAPMTEILLYAASRAQHVAELVQPALAAGKIVISDRFLDSSIAYQGYGLGWDVDLIKNVNRGAINGCLPQMTVLVDLETETALERIRKRDGENADRIESRELLFHRRVREGFLALAAEEPQRFMKIEAATKTPEEIQQEIRLRLKDYLPLRLG